MSVNSLRCRLKTFVPVMSAGMRSGVNWMRAKSQPSTCASVRTSSVLATPGTPSISAWLPVKMAISACSIDVVLADDDFAGFVAGLGEDFFQSFGVHSFRFRRCGEGVSDLERGTWNVKLFNAWQSVDRLGPDRVAVRRAAIGFHHDARSTLAMVWLPACVRDLVHSSKHTSRIFAGGMLRRRRFTKPPAASLPLTKSFWVSSAGGGTRLIEFFQMNNPASSTSAPMTPCNRYFRINTATPEDSTTPRCASSNTDVFRRADEPREQFGMARPPHRFVAQEIGIGRHHDRAATESALDDDGIGASRINRPPRLVEVREDESAVPVERGRQRQIAHVADLDRLIVTIVALFQLLMRKTQTPALLDRGAADVRGVVTQGFPQGSSSGPRGVRASGIRNRRRRRKEIIRAGHRCQGHRQSPTTGGKGLDLIEQFHRQFMPFFLLRSQMQIRGVVFFRKLVRVTEITAHGQTGHLLQTFAQSHRPQRIGPQRGVRRINIPRLKAQQEQLRKTRAESHHAQDNQCESQRAFHAIVAPPIAAKRQHFVAYATKYCTWFRRAMRALSVGRKLTLTHAPRERELHLKALTRTTGSWVTTDSGFKPRRRTTSPSPRGRGPG